MRQGTYLNVILTVNAVLLGGLVWTQLAARPLVAPAAAAQDSPTPSAGGIPDAGEQRKRMIEALERLEQTVEASNRLLTDGKLSVEVSNFDELRAASGSDPAVPVSR